MEDAAHGALPIWPGAEEIITQMLVERFGLDNPKHFQICGIFYLAFLFARVLAVQRTGAGKSMLVLGAATLLRGIIIVVEPLVALGSDQASSSNSKGIGAKGVRSFHLAGMEKTTRDGLVKLLNGMRTLSRVPIILFVSPGDLLKGSQWAAPIARLFDENLITLVALDELHRARTDGRCFRPEFAKLRETLWALIQRSTRKISQLSMTATCTAEILADYKSMMGIGFDYTLWDGGNRRDVAVYSAVSTQPTQAIKAIGKRHIAVPLRRFIVYSNSAQAAAENIPKAIASLIDASDDTSGEVFSVTGESGVIWKASVTKDFSSPTSPLRAVSATSAFNCGVSSPYCGACLCHGSPATIGEFAQILGRAGRAPLAVGTLPCECHVVLSVPLFAFLLFHRNHRIEGGTAHPACRCHGGAPLDGRSQNMRASLP